MPSGSDLVKIAAKHVGEKYVYGAHVPKSAAKWSGPWDCAEFVSWCVYQVTGTLYGCDGGDPASADAYTGYWQRDVELRGTAVAPADAALIPGAIVLRAPSTNKGGHIVIASGDGSTIEAHSTSLGVIKGDLDGRSWTHGILVPGMTYSRNAGVYTFSAMPPIYKLTSPYMHGAEVTKIQRRLRATVAKALACDGVYGPATAAAVRSFQLMNDLVPDGEVGPQTRKALGLEEG